jgi:hypothetical protein
MSVVAPARKTATPPEQTPRPIETPPPEPITQDDGEDEDDTAMMTAAAAAALVPGPGHDECRRRIAELMAQNAELVSRQKRLVTAMRALITELQHAWTDDHSHSHSAAPKVLLEDVAELIVE